MTTSVQSPKVEAQHLFAGQIYETLRAVDIPLESKPGLDGLALTLVMAARVGGMKRKALLMDLIDAAWALSDEIAE
jgi:hypothetical protein